MKVEAYANPCRLRHLLRLSERSSEKQADRHWKGMGLCRGVRVNLLIMRHGVWSWRYTALKKSNSSTVSLCKSTTPYMVKYKYDIRYAYLWRTSLDDWPKPQACPIPCPSPPPLRASWVTSLSAFTFFMGCEDWPLYFVNPCYRVFKSLNIFINKKNCCR